MENNLISYSPLWNVATFILLLVSASYAKRGKQLGYFILILIGTIAVCALETISIIGLFAEKAIYWAIFHMFLVTLIAGYCLGRVNRMRISFYLAAFTGFVIVTTYFFGFLPAGLVVTVLSGVTFFVMEIHAHKA